MQGEESRVSPLNKPMGVWPATSAVSMNGRTFVHAVRFENTYAHSS